MERSTLSPSRIRISAHVVGWMIFFFAPVILSPGPDITTYFSAPGVMSSLVVRNVILMILFYMNLFYITPRLFTPKSQTAFFIVTVLLIFIIGTANFYIHELLTRPAGDFPGRPPGLPGFEHRPPPDHQGPGGPPPRRLMLASPYFSSLLFTALILVASTLLVLWSNWVEAKANEQERTLQKVAAELSVLKLQISPHFLFNTLNNIRWLVRSRSEHAEPALVKLSQLLRYILYQTNQDHVPLDKEIEHLHDYINLQQMRLEGSEAVQFIVEGDLTNKKIVPLLLIPIVENFFKHGDFSQPAEGRIEIRVEGPMLFLKTVNRIQLKSDNKELEESGIGIENVRKRLALHYPDKHELQYHKQDSFYFLTLGIDLS